MPNQPKRPAKQPDADTSGPRYPDPAAELREFMEIVSMLQRRNRAKLDQLSPGARLRKRGA